VEMHLLWTSFSH